MTLVDMEALLRDGKAQISQIPACFSKVSWWGCPVQSGGECRGGVEDAGKDGRPRPL